VPLGSVTESNCTISPTAKPWGLELVTVQVADPFVVAIVEDP